MLLDDLDRARAQKLLELDPFNLMFDFNTLAASAVGTIVAVTTNNDSDFVMRYSNYSAYSAVGVPVVDPDYLVAFTDGSAARGLQDNPIHLRTCL